MDTYSFVDTRPAVSKFNLYKGKPFSDLIPYDVKFQSIGGSDGTGLRMNVPKGRKISFTDFSVDGIQAAKSGKSWYIRLQGNGEAPSIVDPDATPIADQGLLWHATMVDLACVDIWRIMGKYVIEKFGMDSKAKVLPKVIIQSGQADLQACRLVNFAYEKIFFVHEKFTKLNSYDPEEGKRKQLFLDQVVGQTGEAYFNVDTQIKCFDFIWKPLDNLIIVKCFINLLGLDYIDAPTINRKSEESELDKKRDETSSLSRMDAFVKQKEQRIEEEQRKLERKSGDIEFDPIPAPNVEVDLSEEIASAKKKKKRSREVSGIYDSQEPQIKKKEKV